MRFTPPASLLATHRFSGVFLEKSLREIRRRLLLMDTTTLADTLSEPIQTVGLSFYFSPQAIERGKAIDLDVVALYAAGRGGVLGDIDAKEVDEIFYFFKPGIVAGMVEKARGIAPRELAVAAHMDSAWDYAHASFGAVPPAVLDAFSSAASELVSSLPTGQWPIVDGYLALDVPTDTISKAYYWSIILRELRGGVHTDAVKAAAISAAEACQFDREGAFYQLHGYGDDDRVEETPERLERRKAIEADTSQRMASLIERLDSSQQTALLDGARAMVEAVAAPVPAS